MFFLYFFGIDFSINFLGCVFHGFGVFLAPILSPNALKNRTKIGIENKAKKWWNEIHPGIASRAGRGLGRPLKETRNWSTRDQEPGTRDQS